MPENDTIEKLFKIIEKNKNGDPEKSYVARLFRKGRNKIAEKVSEEATETIISAIAEKKEDTINESADLIFHLCVLWAEKGVKPSQVLQEIENRMGMSGIDEKALRKTRQRESEETK